MINTIEVNLNQLMTLSWAKRRKLDNKRHVAVVKLHGFERQKYSFCDMEVTFEDGEILTLRSQVTQNHITKTWTVNGLDGNGNQVAVRMPE